MVGVKVGLGGCLLNSGAIDSKWQRSHAPVTGMRRPRGLVQRIPRYVIEREETDGESEVYIIAGYTDKEDLLPTKSKPRFELTPIRTTNNKELVMSNPGMIKKIIKTTRVSVEDSIKLNFLQSAIRFLKRSGTNSEIREHVNRSIKIELQYTPTKDELHQMINSNDEDPGRWNDLGFEIEGQDGIIWMNKSKLKTDFEIKSIDEESGIAKNTSDLIEELSSIRSQIFGNEK